MGVECGKLSLAELLDHTEHGVVCEMAGDAGIAFIVVALVAAEAEQRFGLVMSSFAAAVQLTAIA